MPRHDLVQKAGEAVMQKGPVEEVSTCRAASLVDGPTKASHDRRYDRRDGAQHGPAELIA
jgi:hypothetical protein